MKELYIGDLHGDIRVFNIFKLFDKYDKVIFLGDYLDPYSDCLGQISEVRVTNTCIRNNRSDLALFLFKNLVEYVLSRKDKDKFLFICGNHDLNYIDKQYTNRFVDESSYLIKAKEIFDKLFSNNMLVASYYSSLGYLATHAGVCQSFINSILFKGDDVKELSEYLNKLFLSKYGSSLSVFGNNIDSCMWVRNLGQKEIPEFVGKQIYAHNGLVEKSSDGLRIQIDSHLKTFDTVFNKLAVLEVSDSGTEFIKC